jgi:hypothetical protein
MGDIRAMIYRLGVILALLVAIPCATWLLSPIAGFPILSDNAKLICRAGLALGAVIYLVGFGLNRIVSNS